MNQFVESLKRLYESNMLNEDKVVEIFVGGKITEEEKWYILNARKGL